MIIRITDPEEEYPIQFISSRGSGAFSLKLEEAEALVRQLLEAVAAVKEEAGHEAK